MSSLAYLALWGFVFALPWESTVVVIPGVGIISKATGVLALGSAMAMALLTGRVRRLALLHVAGLLFVVWAAANLLIFHSGQKLPLKFWTFVQLYAVLWMIWELAPSWNRQMGLLLAYVLGAHIAGLDTIMLWLRSHGALRRYTAGGTDANDLAMTLALALPMAWYLGMTHGRPLVRWIARAYIVLGIFAVGLTGSRGGMLASITALTIVPLTLTRLAPSRRIAAVVLMGLAGALAVAYIPDQIVERLATTGSQVEGGSISGRGRIWKAGLSVWAQQPFTGYGTGAFKLAVSPILGESTQVAHNSFISILVEEGLIGFVCYATMLLTVFRSTFKLPTLERRFAMVLFCTMGVALTPLTWEDKKAVWFVMAALLGISRAWIAQVRAAALAGAPSAWPAASAVIGRRGPRGVRPAPAPQPAGSGVAR
jgi:O-antigen ligase